MIYYGYVSITAISDILSWIKWPDLSTQIFQVQHYFSWTIIEKRMLIEAAINFEVCSKQRQPLWQSYIRDEFNIIHFMNSSFQFVLSKLERFFCALENGRWFAEVIDTVYSLSFRPLKVNKSVYLLYKSSYFDFVLPILSDWQTEKERQNWWLKKMTSVSLLAPRRSALVMLNGMTGI